MNLPLKPVGGVCGEAGGVCIGVQGAPSATSFTVGKIGIGPSWTAEDSMAASIIWLEQEREESNARIAVLEEQARILVAERDQAWEALQMAAQRARVQAGAYKLEDLRDNSRWSIFNEGRAQALEKFAEELEGRQ